MKMLLVGLLAACSPEGEGKLDDTQKNDEVSDTSDADQDGYPADEDCDDTDERVELCSFASVLYGRDGFLLRPGESGELGLGQALAEAMGLDHGSELTGKPDDLAHSIPPHSTIPPRV